MKSEVELAGKNGIVEEIGILEQTVQNEYKYGFVTDIEAAPMIYWGKAGIFCFLGQGNGLI